jgi:hypothetical protein
MSYTDQKRPVVLRWGALAGVNTSDLGLRGQDLTPLLAGAVEPEPEMLAAADIDFRPLLEGSGEVEGRPRYAHFTFDDHQSGTAYTNVVPGLNRIRAVPSKDAMYAVYFDPGDPTRFEYELYDMTRDPGQQRNLVHRDTGEVLDPADSSLRDRLHAALWESMREARTEIPIEPPGPG